MSAEQIKTAIDSILDGNDRGARIVLRDGTTLNGRVGWKRNEQSDHPAADAQGDRVRIELEKTGGDIVEIYLDEISTVEPVT